MSFPNDAILPDQAGRFHAFETISQSARSLFLHQSSLAGSVTWYLPAYRLYTVNAHPSRRFARSPIADRNRLATELVLRKSTLAGHVFLESPA